MIKYILSVEIKENNGNGACDLPFLVKRRHFFADDQWSKTVWRLCDTKLALLCVHSEQTETLCTSRLATDQMFKRTVSKRFFSTSKSSCLNARGTSPDAHQVLLCCSFPQGGITPSSPARGTTSLPGLDGGTPSQDWMGYPSRKDGMG